MRRKIFLIFYYGFATWLPNSYLPVLGKFSNAIRVFCVKRIFKKCGKINTINRKVNFGSGKDIEMGDYSGIGANVDLPNDTIIGKYVMIGRQTHILRDNHRFDRTDIPINLQGYQGKSRTIIDDDCWIGMRTFMTPGRHVKEGTIVGACAVLTKDFEPYSVVGGNPAKLIKMRK